MYPLATDVLQVLLEGRAREDVLYEVRAVQAAHDASGVRYASTKGGYLPV